MADEHGVVRRVGGYYRDNSRGLIEVTGKDRAGWLHNLTTNVVRTLQAGEGNYAFAVTAQGRTLFDLNILVHEQAMWLDIDRRWLDAALKHLNKYIIVEHVKLKDISADWARFAIVGPAAGVVIAALGLPGNFDAMAALQHVSATIGAAAVELIREDLGPVRRAVLWTASSGAEDAARRIAAAAGAQGMIAMGDELIEMIRIEVGVPASVTDIDEQVIPPETLQVERGISYVKGCYLGQEIIERMRSRGSMARRLVGLRMEGEQLPPHNAPIFADGKEVGRLTSACHSVALGGVLALGYVKTLLIQPQVQLQAALDENTVAAVQIVELPLPIWQKQTTAR